MECNTHTLIAYHLLGQGVHLSEIKRFFDAAPPSVDPVADTWPAPPPSRDPEEDVETSPGELTEGRATVHERGAKK
jgi:hypothetical protein